MSYSEEDWRKEARRILKGELARRGIGYDDLADRLTAIGSKETVSGIKGKLHRGTFSFFWLLQCLEAMGLEEFKFTVRLK